MLLCGEWEAGGRDGEAGVCCTVGVLLVLGCRLAANSAALLDRACHESGPFSHAVSCMMSHAHVRQHQCSDNLQDVAARNVLHAASVSGMHAHGATHGGLMAAEQGIICMGWDNV